MLARAVAHDKFVTFTVGNQPCLTAAFVLPEYEEPDHGAQSFRGGDHSLALPASRRGSLVRAA